MVKRLTYEDVEQFINDPITGEGCTLLSKEYINNHEKLNIKCKCGTNFEKSFNSFRRLNQRRCYDCGIKIRTNKNKTPYEKVKRRIEERGYCLLSEEYTNDLTHLQIKCEYGHVYSQTYAQFKRNRKCHYCNNSEGEKIIVDVLTKFNIKFIKEKEYLDLKSIKGYPLRFDFYITYNNKDLLIEYDGEFHYLPLMGQEKLEYQQSSDQIKNEYCRTHNIPLIRISYLQFNKIETILAEKLTKLGLLTPS